MRSSDPWQETFRYDTPLCLQIQYPKFSLFLFTQQYAACFVRNTWMVGGARGVIFSRWYLSFSMNITNHIIYNTGSFLVGRVFADGPGDSGSIPGHVLPNTFKMVLDTSLQNTQQYKVRIKGKMKQSNERGCALPFTSVL